MSEFTRNPVHLGGKEIAVDDTFKFSCSGCGNCCRWLNNKIAGNEIFLSEPDIIRISKLLNLPIVQVIEKYVKIDYDSDLNIYLCRLKIKSTGVCVFLRTGTCHIYEGRPRTCALYPLAREIQVYFDSRREHYAHYEDKYYICSDKEPQYKCGDAFQYTVGEWLVKNRVPIEDTDDREWFTKLISLSEKGKKLSADDPLHRNLFCELYLSNMNDKFDDRKGKRIDD